MHMTQESAPSQAALEADRNVYLLQGDNARLCKAIDSLTAWLMHRFGPDSPEGREAQIARKALEAKEPFARFERDTEKRIRESIAGAMWSHDLAAAPEDIDLLWTDEAGYMAVGSREGDKVEAEGWTYVVERFTRWRELPSLSSIAGEANVERVAQRIERAPVRIYRTPEEARAYMLGRADAVALVRAKLVSDVDDHIAALATLERTTDAG